MVTSFNYFCSLIQSLYVNCNKVKFSPFGFQSVLLKLKSLFFKFKLSRIELVRNILKGATLK